ncbi:MAG TPA: glutamate--tRNA ligase family protein, partial [Candidatus Saccharimonadia bacterium]|nr:glutamate--tRNA ligase family protein [Candidatus Saccharimonadia bacterium]
GAVSVMQYRDDGYLPHALLNYIVRLGWSHGDQEIFTRDQLIGLFSVDDVNKSAARFDFDKLAWLNQQYLKSEPPESIARHFEWHLRAQGLELADGPAPADLVVALRDRVRTLKEMAERARAWFVEPEAYDPSAVEKHFGGRASEALAAVRERLATIDETTWRPESVDAALKAAAEWLGEGLGKVAQPLRVAITGTAVSPAIDHTVFLCGKPRALARIDRALVFLAARG